MQIDWGDGSRLENPHKNVLAGAFSYTHPYLDDDADDSYTIAVTVTDDDGGSVSDSTTVAVANLAPAAAITGPGQQPGGRGDHAGRGCGRHREPRHLQLCLSVTKDGSPFALPAGTVTDQAELHVHARRPGHLRGEPDGGR